MVASLTGFGRAERTDDRGRVCVELKSVNNRYLQLDVHLPYGCACLDAPIRALVGESVFRGKVYLNLELIDYSPNQKIVVNKPLISKLFELQKELEKDFDRPINVNLDGFLTLPGIIKTENLIDQDEMWERIKPIVQAALKSFLEFRIREGGKLAEDLRNRQGKLRSLLQGIVERLPGFRQEFEERFRQRIGELARKADLDETRLNTEIAIWTEKSDVSEEITRLGCHIEALGEILKLDEPIGRKLDFLLQELNREANTMNNKAGDLSIIQNVLEIKSEVEKIREQAQNLE